MIAETIETVLIVSPEDIVRVRKMVRTHAVTLGFSLVDQTKIITAASEIARNTVVYGGGGKLEISRVSHLGRSGLQLAFIDHGPGIPDIAQAMNDGFSTGGGLGLGLSGAKRLSNQFDVCSVPGEGTNVTLIRWK